MHCIRNHVNPDLALAVAPQWIGFVSSRRSLAPWPELKKAMDVDLSGKACKTVTHPRIAQPPLLLTHFPVLAGDLEYQSCAREVAAEGCSKAKGYQASGLGEDLQAPLSQVLAKVLFGSLYVVFAWPL